MTARSKPDHYLTLGLRPGAALEQIKAAYRRRALRYHPDKNQGDEAAAEQFKLCSDAYTVISDPIKRTEYDRLHLGHGVQDMALHLIGDLLGSRRRRPVHGRDLRYHLELSFTEAVLGTKKKIHFETLEDCSSCEGTGAAPGGSRPCPECGGRRESKGRPWPLLRICPRCGGQGIAISQACSSCVGVGTVEKMREYLVVLQPGVKDGEKKIVYGQGESGGRGGRSGDLHVLIEVAEHPFFTQEDENLLVKAPIRFSTAVLGGTAEVPTLEGKVQMKVPPGTQSGRVFRLPGKGLPPGQGSGDLFVQVEVETPVGIEAEHERLLLTFEQRCGEEMYPRLQSFQAKLRSHLS